MICGIIQARGRTDSTDRHFKNCKPLRKPYSVIIWFQIIIGTKSADAMSDVKAALVAQAEQIAKGFKSFGAVATQKVAYA